MDDDTGKRCARCGQRKPLSGFSPHPTGRDGYRNICKACRSEYESQRNAANGLTKIRWQRMKDQVLDHYGRACACCGATDRLSMDHVNGDGQAHRLRLYGDSRVGTGTRFYLWLIRNDFPEGFQVLCLPCNQSKGSGPACRLHSPPRHCPTCTCLPPAPLEGQ